MRLYRGQITNYSVHGGNNPVKYVDPDGRDNEITTVADSVKKVVDSFIVFTLLLSFIFYAGCRTTRVQQENILGDSYTANAEIFFNKGIKFNKEQNYAQAINSFTEAINIDTSFQGAYVARGSAYYILRMYDEALHDFEYAIFLGPQSIPTYSLAYFMKGRYYIALNDYEKAIESFNQALSLGIGYPELYHERGVAYYHIGKMAESLTDVTFAINMEPENFKYSDTRGTIYFDLKMYNHALNDLLFSLRLNPNNALTLANCGELARYLGNYEDSLNFYNQAIFLDNSLSTAYNGRGNLYMILADLTNDINEKREYIKKAEADFHKNQ